MKITTMARQVLLETMRYGVLFFRVQKQPKRRFYLAALICPSPIVILLSQHFAHTVALMSRFRTFKWDVPLRQRLIKRRRKELRHPAGN